MSQNSGCCDSNDYSLLTANVGVANISSAVSALTGAGASPVFTASSSFNGSIIRSIRIKATVPVTTGMIRLFIGNSGGTSFALYKEIPVTTTPVLDTVPMPMPVLPTFEMILHGGLKLLSGYKLYAATQNAQSFNIVTEGLDWKYPATLPSSCCNYKQETAQIGMSSSINVSTVLAPIAPPYPTTIFSAPASINGSLIKTITVKALQPTAINGMVRIFISPDGSAWTLIQEIMVPQTNQSGFEPSWKAVVDLDMHINTGYSIGATTHLAESFGITVEALNWTYPIS